jgi:hypothetical protein
VNVRAIKLWRLNEKNEQHIEQNEQKLVRQNLKTTKTNKLNQHFLTAG